MRHSIAMTALAAITALALAGCSSAPSDKEKQYADTVAVYDSKGEPVVYDEGSPTEAQQAHIVRHSPAAVLRRIAADRKTLDECVAAFDWDNWGAASLAETAIRNLAEGWGWTEEEQR